MNTAAIRRRARLQQMVRDELANLLRNETEDPELSTLSNLISILDVQISPDNQHAKVFVSVLGDEDEARAKVRRLQRAARFFRRELAERLNLRHTPAIEFVHDTSIVRGARVLELLNTLPEPAADS
jgi:ribosome-binding factor A